jgi:hypothetical protein
MLKIGLCSSNIFSLSTVPISLGFGKDHLKQGANPTKKNTLLRVIPTMTFQNSLLTPLLSDAFVTGLLPK